MERPYDFARHQWSLFSQGRAFLKEVVVAHDVAVLGALGCCPCRPALDVPHNLGPFIPQACELRRVGLPRGVGPGQIGVSSVEP